MARLPPLYAWDTETDPFTPGQIVRPFVWGLWDGKHFEHYWNDDAKLCIEAFVRFAETLPAGIITAHNGGRFDFIWLLPYIDPDPVIINGRIVQARLGKHLLHDSFATHPEALAVTGDKGKLNYHKLRAPVRHRFREEIVAYLRQDCVALWNMVAAFQARFGHKITMASAAIQRLKQAPDGAGGAIGDHIERLSLRQDALFRPFYFGGRVEAFEQGLLKAPWKLHDVTGMYPDAMAHVAHPVGNLFGISRRLDDDTDFADVDAISRGALPARKANGGLHFPHGRARFMATGHELRAGIALGLVDVIEVHAAYSCSRRMTFKNFIYEYAALKRQADIEKDKYGRSHWKRVQNSSYGRFSLDPDKLFEWRVIKNPHTLPALGTNQLGLDQIAFLDDISTHSREGFTLYQQGPEVAMMRRPVDDRQKARAILNVATGASITGAARAKLLYALVGAERPVYCDTDSLICLGMGTGPGIELGDGLGQWKIEAEGDRIAIAGKKLYALFNGMECVKYASKGARLQPMQIIQVAQGRTVVWSNPAPTFGVAGVARFVERHIRMTGAGI